MTPVVAPWDLPGQVAQAINAWLTSFAQSIFDFAVDAIASLLALTPHFERTTQVERLWNVTRGIADGFLSCGRVVSRPVLGGLHHVYACAA